MTPDKIRERPILFNGEMVRAILDGRKTQTRRVIKAQPVGEWAAPGRTMCPYGLRGDHLWVRETWFELVDPMTSKTYDPPRACYRATEENEVIVDDGDGAAVINKDGTFKSPWSPSIYMPRWASRITLEITNVRVERVQDISEEDAKAEGIIYDPCDHVRRSCEEIGCLGPLIAPFRDFWDSINAKRGYSWDSNPWVWVIEFKVDSRREV